MVTNILNLRRLDKNSLSVQTGLFIILLLVLLCGCESKSAVLFDKAKWDKSRRSNPDLNETPSMLDDLMMNHLSRGMTLTDVTNLLGQVEIKTSSGPNVRIRGEFLEQTIYIYRPGTHNGWLIVGTNSVILYFGRDGRYLREWLPAFPVVQSVSAIQSDATRSLLSNGSLYIGNPHFASTPSQFDTLLGPPDEKLMEYQLDYFLGKRSRFASNDVFLELHFDENKKLSRITCSEH